MVFSQYSVSENPYRYQTTSAIKSFLKNVCLFLILYMHMGLCGCMFQRVQVPVETRRGKMLDTLELVLTGCYELPDMGPGNQTWVFGKSSTLLTSGQSL